MAKVDGTPEQFWNSTDAEGRTFMHIAADRLCYEHFELALKNGYFRMTKEIEDHTGQTWWQIFKSKPYGLRNKIQCLLDSERRFCGAWFGSLCGERVESNEYMLIGRQRY